MKLKGSLVYAGLVTVLVCSTLGVFGAPTGGKGHGGIVLRENVSVYKRGEGDAVRYVLSRGDAVAAVTVEWASGGAVAYQWPDEGTRLRISYIEPGRKIGTVGWVERAAVGVFVYEFCGSADGPFVEGLIKPQWTLCFQEARDAKLDELRPRWEAEDKAKKAGE